MRILIIGSGGREHAIGWKIAQDIQRDNLFFLPGNAGTANLGHNIAGDVMDFEHIKEVCLANQVDTLFVGPENPLCDGIYDSFKADADLGHIAVIGPSKRGAQLEGSKDFAKEFMQKYNIPTARYQTFTLETLERGKAFLKELSAPYVLKADGPAAGKGVVILDSYDEAAAELEDMLKGKFGASSSKVVIEEFLSGIECSVFVLTDGKSYKILPVAKDYKRIGEGDTGLNTGGMGAISPVPFADDVFMKKVKEQIVLPTLDGIQKEEIEYKGFIFLGLIKVNDDPYVIEYNVRLGDPETEAIMLRIKSSLVALLQGVANQTLDQVTYEEEDYAAATVMLVSGGYPEAYEKGKVITEELIDSDDVVVFHAGTAVRDSEIVTNGGRVISVSAKGKSLEEVLSNAYEATDKITFEGKFYRKDLGFDL
ncbi:phosphoribosylamine--glycine ligase [Halosquirtibacter xylanolyticus]|uniref:phosphoribosylamine--glycine ligase n=1 Tax=Halosquirtibacter xylanolyticus TaxID=3374599 RepID=UPI0037498DAB|nr:phosphoribosylamine--glycine ligase [Prolixibacteraceae bacterium]